MNIKKGSISSKDLIFAVFCFMQGTTLRSGYIVGITKQDSWAMAITGFVFSLPLLAVYAALLKKYPEKNLFEINDAVLGPLLGKIVSALYLFFFLSLAALNARDLGNLVLDFLIPETPIAAVILVFLAGCVYTIRKGINNLMNLSIFICILSIGSVLINSILLLKDFQPGFLKPIFRLEPMVYLQGTVSVAAVPLGEVLAFMMITPMLRKDAKAAKPLFLGILFSSVFMAAVIARDIMALGPLVAVVSLPSFESVRYISISGVLTRMESVYAVTLIFLFIFKVSILLYAFVLGLTQIFKRKSSISEIACGENSMFGEDGLSAGESHPPLLLVSAALVLFYSIFVFESVMENRNWGATAAPFFSLTFEFFLPALTLLAATLRGLFKPREVKT